MEIKLSDETLIGLKRLCNLSLVNGDNFERLLKDCLDASVGNVEKEKSELQEYKSDVLKTAYAALTVLLTEAARHNLDGFKLRTTLEGYNFDADRVAIIIDEYMEKKNDIQKRLFIIGTNLPHIVDVRWRIDYRVQSDYPTDSALQPYILVELVTISPQNTTEIIKFVCTTQNLRELIFSLRAAARHMSKMSNPS